MKICGKQSGKNCEKKIREYRGVMPQDESVHEQYCLYQEARTMIAEKNTGSSLCGILEKGICLTIPEFRKSMEKVRLYSPVEIGMILLLIHYDPSKTEMAEQELLNILAYVSGYQSGGKKEKVSTDIFLELISIQQRKMITEKLCFTQKKRFNVSVRERVFIILQTSIFCGQKREKSSRQKMRIKICC